MLGYLEQARTGFLGRTLFGAYSTIMGKALICPVSYIHFLLKWARWSCLKFLNIKGSCLAVSALFRCKFSAESIGENWNSLSFSHKVIQTFSHTGVPNCLI